MGNPLVYYTYTHTMGSSQSKLEKNRATLKIYSELTVFSTAEILKLYAEFMRIGELDQTEAWFTDYSRISTEDEAKAAIAKAYRIKDETFVNSFYKGDELNLAENP